MGYHKIGIVGATGRLGREVTRALVDNGFDVVPFSRQSTTVAGIATQPLGSLIGFDVIVSTVGVHGVDDQIPIIQRAKQDGVKRFVPAEFGIDHRYSQEKYSDSKRKIAEAVERAEFPDGWTSIACGFFDFIMGALVVIDKANATITVPGSSQKEYPFLRCYDVGRVLGEVFRHPERYKNQWLLIAGDWLSLQEIAQQVQQLSSTEMSIRNIATDQRTPVLHMLENMDGNIFERQRQTSLPISFSPVADYIKECMDID